MIVAVPVAVGVNVTEHEPVTSVQLGALKVPAAAPVLVNVTVPVGVLPVPLPTSATVAVHVDATPTATGEVHEIVVEVVLLLTTTVVLPLLAECVESPGKLAIIVAVPDALGVVVAVHV